MMHFSTLNSEEIPKELIGLISNYMRSRNGAKENALAKQYCEIVLKAAEKNHLEWLISNKEIFIEEAKALNSSFSEASSEIQVAVSLLNEIQKVKELESLQSKERQDINHLLTMANKAREISSYFMGIAFRTGMLFCATLIPIALYLNCSSTYSNLVFLSNALTQSLDETRNLINNLKDLLNTNQAFDTLGQSIENVGTLVEQISHSVESDIIENDFSTRLGQALNHQHFPSMNSTYYSVTNQLDILKNSIADMKNLVPKLSQWVENAAGIVNDVTQSINGIFQVVSSSVKDFTPVPLSYIVFGAIATTGLIYYGSKTFFACREQSRIFNELEKTSEKIKLAQPELKK